MIFGVPAMPSVLLNAALSLLHDRSLAVIGPDRIAAFAPMYNEGEAARDCLESLLAQTDLPDEIVVSVNGGDDDTYGVVTRTLTRAGLRCEASGLDAALDAGVERWTGASGGAPGPSVTVIDRYGRTSKSDSINEAVARGLVRSERILVTDGDTVFDTHFVARLREHFYRLSFSGRGDERRPVVEDVALQSGNVTSYTLPGASLAARCISAARRSEYAFGSVLRRGQVARLGDGPLFGRSRLFTVVGCGFVVRRDLLPLPDTTMTEDHDLTLRTQDHPGVRTRRRVRDLDAKGFAVVRRGGAVPLADVVEGETVEFHAGASARFVGEALMRTQDPPHLDGYLGQVERWHGGAQQGVLQRLGRALRPNVGLTMWAAVLENLLGIALMAALLGAVALHQGNPSLGMTPAVLALAVAIDVGAASLLVALGLYRYRRDAGDAWPLARSLAWTVLGAVPYTLLRYLGPVMYLAAALRVVPDHLRRRRGAWRGGGAAWERPATRVRTLSHVLLPGGVVVSGVLMTGLATFAPLLNPINEEAWRLTYEVDGVRLDPDVELVVLRPDPAASVPSGGRSAYCEPSFMSRTPPTSAEPRFGARGVAERYEPLSGWELVALARLVPLTGLLDAAVEAYGVPGNLYLRVLLNESYLDPLAVGATDDHGLSQQNEDSLTMLRALSGDPADPLHNPRLFGAPFSVYDPDFSTCAGAAKLAWALRQDDARSDEHAYALYINPVAGVRNGRMSGLHAELAAVMMRLEPLVTRLEHAAAAYDDDPARLARRDREAFEIAEAVRSGAMGVEAAYRRAHAFVVRQGLPDEAHYARLVGELEASGPAVDR